MIKKKSKLPYLFDVVVVSVLAIISIIMIYPFLYIVAVSLSNYKLVPYVTFYPMGINFDAFRYIFSLHNVQVGYFNSVKYTFVGVSINMIMTILCAYPLSKKRLIGRGVVNIFILITMYFGGGLIPSYLLITNVLHIQNSIWAIVLPGALGTWNMIVLRTYFMSSIPSDIEESCYIDGANEWQVLFKIYLPLAKPILATIGLFYFVGAWNSWFPASIYLDNAKDYPIQLVLRNVIATTGSSFLGQSQTELMKNISTNARIDGNSLNNALTLAVVLPIILIYPFCQRYFIKGVMVGSIKG
jgi:putative aldouronate transport system permease protein